MTGKADPKEVAARMATTKRRATKKAKTAGAAPREMDLSGFSPILVAFMRGLIHAMLMAAITYVTTQLGNLEGAGAIGTVAVVAVGAVRSLEGVLDKLLLGAPRQQKLLGGKDVGS